MYVVCLLGCVRVCVCVCAPRTNQPEQAVSNVCATCVRACECVPSACMRVLFGMAIVVVCVCVVDGRKKDKQNCT